MHRAAAAAALSLTQKAFVGAAWRIVDARRRVRRLPWARNGRDRSAGCSPAGFQPAATALATVHHSGLLLAAA